MQLEFFIQGSQGIAPKVLLPTASKHDTYMDFIL